MNVRSVCSRFLKLRRSLLECKQQSWSCSQRLRVISPTKSSICKVIDSMARKTRLHKRSSSRDFSTSIKAKMLESDKAVSLTSRLSDLRQGVTIIFIPPFRI